MGGDSSKSMLPPDFDYVDHNHFVNEDKQKLFCRYWQPESRVRALVFISHGVAEHSGCYVDLAKYLNKHDMLVFSHDHVGHGLSEGSRVHVNTMEVYYRDVIQHVKKMTEQYPDIPVFMVGHSMGGTIAICTSVRSPELFKGLVLIAPAIVANPETATPAKVALAKVVSSVMPHLHVGQLDITHICRDEQVQKRYDEDPLGYHKGLKAKWSVAMLKALDEIKHHSDKITIPFLCLNGDEDKLCHVDGARFLHKHANSVDKTLEIYKGGYHQLHQEPDGMKERCYHDVCDWIMARV